MVDLDSNPTKLLEVVEVGKQLLMTRGALTTFSVANDVAKYFAILPALFVAAYPELAPLDVMHLASPWSAILSAVIFNALIIVAADPAGAARRALPPGRRGGPAAPLAPHLRRGRRGGPLRRHQGHRPRPLRPRARLSLQEIAMRTQLAPRPPRSPWSPCSSPASAYPLLVTGLAQALFPWRAEGSLVTSDLLVVGSELIGQAFAAPGYLQPRGRRRPARAGTPWPRAAPTSGRPPGRSGSGSRPRRRGSAPRTPRRPGPVPAELVTASGSGLDPHLSPAAARWQAPRIARARGRRAWPGSRR